MVTPICSSRCLKFGANYIKFLSTLLFYYRTILVFYVLFQENVNIIIYCKLYCLVGVGAKFIKVLNMWHLIYYLFYSKISVAFYRRAVVKIYLTESKFSSVLTFHKRKAESPVTKISCFF